MAEKRSKWGRGQIARGIVRLEAASDEPVVDRENRIIRGCSVITRGEALGHGFWIDSEFVDQTVKGGREAGTSGIKARFTHPGLCSDGMGKYLGRWQSFSRDGDRARADLHLADVASRTPDGDLAGYVMDLAEEDPKAFGASITFDHDWDAADQFADEYQVFDEEKNRRVFKSPDPDNAQNLPHVRMKRLRTADVVDEPAANPEGLFGRGSKLAAAADKFLDWALGGEGEPPELEPAFGVDAERARSFLTGYLDRRGMRLTALAGGQTAVASALTKEKNMAGEKEATPDVAKLQAEAKAAGVEEGSKAALGALNEMLAAFPKDQPYAVESFRAGLTVEKAKAAYADKLTARVEQLEAEKAKAEAERKPAPPAAGKAAQFKDGGGAEGDFLAVAEALAAEKGLSIGAAMSQVAREQPELHAKFLGGGKG